MSYTEETATEIIAEYVASPCRETVDAIAERLDKSVRSVIAKLSSAGVYQTPQRKTKTGEDIEKKEDMVVEVCTWLGIEAPTLAKTGKQDLKKVRDALKQLIVEIQ